ncbi:MAG: hypothetical protein KKH12_02465 [Gammaproteobacteria bacterium]|nr:hypothetical protein [Gammaproteobacteria bacterium]MBU1480517.1 hypothetical protein [Gammaproteobacteria bacterium]
MRIVPSLPPVTKSPNTRQVGGLTAIHSVKAVQLQEQAVPVVEKQPAQQEAARLVEQQRHHEGPFEDRRKVCRRVAQQAVLVDLRSGLDRRRRNQRGDDLVEHIDETV